MLTLSTFYNREQLALQHKAMEVWGMKECLESRFVSVCLDTKCMDVCRDNSIKNCFLLPFEMGPIPPEEVMGASFRFLMYLKHLLMHEALKVVKEVIIFDVDVELFKNPFVDTLYRRRDDGSRDLSSPPPDMMWQAEWNYSMSCAGTPNGGQLYLRNSTRLAKYWEVFFAHRESFLDDGKSDQDQLLEIIAQTNVTYCSLPYTRFTAHNLNETGVFNATAPAVETVSYHTSGVSGNINKLMHLDRMLKGLKLVKNNATTSANQQFVRYWL